MKPTTKKPGIGCSRLRAVKPGWSPRIHASHLNSTANRPQKQRLVQWLTYSPVTSKLRFSTTW